MATVSDNLRLSISRLSAAAWLCIVMAAIFICLHIAAIVDRFAGAGSALSAAAATQLMLPSSAADVAVKPWTVITYPFVHYDALHALLNIAIVFFYASLLQQFTTKRKMLAIFFSGSVAAALAFVISGSSSSSAIPLSLTGASASALALIGAITMVAPKLKVKLVLFGETPLWIVSATILILTTLGSVGPQTHLAHVAGLVMGIAMGWKFRDTRVGVIRPRTKIAGNFAPHEEAALNEILRKVRMSGFGSLSDHERRKLYELSSKLPSTPAK